MRVRFSSFALGGTEHNSDTNTELCGLCPQACSCGVRGSILVFQTGGTESWSVTSFDKNNRNLTYHSMNGIIYDERNICLDMNYDVILRKMRHSTKLSQRKFAERFFIPVSTYEHWEMGVRIPPIYVVKMIAVILYNEGCVDITFIESIK